MAGSSGYQALRKAVLQAKVGTDAELEFEETTVLVAALAVKQLRVTYLSGNEYLSLVNLQEGLEHAGELKAFEYRGRGSEEQPTLVADVDIEGDKYQIVYLLA